MNKSLSNRKLTAAVPEPLLFSIQAAQAILGGVSRAHVYNCIERGLLEKRNLGARAFITAASIKRLAGAA